MKKVQIYLSFITIVALLYSCGGSSGGSKEKEPNNTIEQANEITLEQVFEIKISPKKDVDWFKVEIPEQGYLIIQGNQIPENLKLQARFSLYQEWEGKKEKVLKNWTYLPAVIHLKESGTYYFIILDDYNDQESDQSIQLKATFIKEFDTGEFNNTVKEAVSVSNGDVKQIAIYPKGDQDIFVFKAEQQGYLKIMEKGVPGNINLQSQHFTYDEWSEPKEKVIRNWKDLPSACFIPSAGDYYVRIVDDYHDSGSQQLFSVKFDFVPETDIHEPNNKYDVAAKIAIGDTLKMMIFPKHDYDYFTFNSGEINEIFLVARDFEGITPEARVYILDSVNNLKAIDNWKEIPCSFKLENDIDYYMLIHDNYDDNQSEKIFELLIKSNG